MSDKPTPENTTQAPAELTESQLDDVGGGATAAPKPIKPKAPTGGKYIETEDGTVIWVG